MTDLRLRVVTLLASGTEIVCHLGLADQLVGISHECDHPDSVLDRPRVTRTRVLVESSSRQIDEQVKSFSSSGDSLYEIDEQTIAMLKPDVIVTQAQCDVCAVNHDDVVSMCHQNDSLRNARIVALNPTTLDGIYADVWSVAEACDVARTGAERIEALRNRVNRVKEQADGLDKPRVICLEWLDPIMAAANWLPELINLAGGDCVMGHRGERSRYAEWDSVVAADPEVLVLMPCGFDLQRTATEAQVLKEMPGWTGLSAVKNNRVYFVDANAYFTRPGPRIVDSLEILAHLIHPEAFDAVATDRPAYGRMV